jgi:tetratricopeptide (TPR) repeat protein
LTILDNPGRQELTEILEQGQYQVFHYAGHSNLGHFGGDIYLVNRATGLTEPFAGDDLAGLLVNNGVQFAVFNSCHGADGITGLNLNESTEKSLAQALVRRGIPAVLAMSAQIPDQVALTFTRLLYRNLHQGYPIDFSLGRVRQGLISAYGSNQLYWALPVLYMNPIFHGLLQHRPLNREGLAELLHLSDVEISALSPEDENRLAIAELPGTNGAFWADEDEASLFAPPQDHNGGEDTAFIKGILSEISSDLQDIKGGKSIARQEPRGLVITNTRQSFKQVLSRYQMPIAIGAAAAIAFGGLAYWQRDSSPNIRTPPEQTVSVNQNSDFAPLDSAMLVAIARKEKDNWPILRKVATELLDRQANSFASEVLAEIARENEAEHDYAELSFLRGRLAWQTALKGEDNMYSVEDARRAWETAHKENPDSVAYLNALGFAYYAEANYAAASDTWAKAFTLSETVAVSDLDLAQTFAGLALGFYQEDQAGSDQDPAGPGNKVEKMRDSAISFAPEQMSTSALAQNWLWSEGAIADWQTIQTWE